ncbi:MAG: hypothetical protein ACM3KR_05550 [Deltaproteobacteria bacterium]
MKIRLYLLLLGVILLIAGILTVIFIPPLWVIGSIVIALGLIILLLVKLYPKLHCHHKLLYHILTILGLTLILLGAAVLAISPVLLLGLTLIAVGIILLELGLLFLID